MRRFAKQTRTATMEKTPAEERPPAKTEAELIATVANIQDAERSLLFAQRARNAGMPALAAACEERAKTLTPIKPARAKKKSASLVGAAETARADPDQDGGDAKVAAN
jgi:hypothetical protein